MAGQRRRQPGGDGRGCAHLRLTRRRDRFLKGTLTGAAALLALAACGESGVTGLDNGPRQIATGPMRAGTNATLDQRLVGSWSRVVFFAAPDGFLRSSETRWTFEANGRVVRRTIITNFTLAVLEEIVAAGTWRTDGVLLTIEWLTPVQETFVSEYQVTPTLHGSRLLLGQQHYDRLSPF